MAGCDQPASLHGVSFKEKESNNGSKKGNYTRDGTVDRHGKPAIKGRTGGWKTGILILVNQGLATLAFFGVGVNLVLFLTRVLHQSNAEAANNVSKWTGTVYIFSLAGAFVSDSYWGRFKTCAIFQLIFVFGLVLLSLSTHLFLVKPQGCGIASFPCEAHSTLEIGTFYVSIYLVALGNGGYQPSIATFGADQFDEEDPHEGLSKIAFFSYFYLALNLGSLVSNTILVYYEDSGSWALGFWMSAASAFVALVLFLCGTPTYRHFEPQGNPLCRFCQVITAAVRKWRIESPQDGKQLFEVDKDDSAFRKILHTDDFKFLDKAAVVTVETTVTDQSPTRNQWQLCTVTQVEEVKCILRLLPIWLCTIIYSVMFTQMASLFVVQGEAMKTNVYSFHVPPASMSSFDIMSVALFIFLYRRVVCPCYSRLTGKNITELQRMGVGLIIAAMAMISAGIVEHHRLKYVKKGSDGSSSLSILWQIPQYALVGASEVFMYVGQLEFFNGQAPDGLKSFGSALCMTSISFGNYFSTLIVTIVMQFTTRNDIPGWIPGNLNVGHLDRFYFLLTLLAAMDLLVYVVCAKWYKGISLEERGYVIEGEGEGQQVV